MEITNEMQATMIVSLLRHDKTPQGVECSFFQFGTTGVKFYGYGEDAEESASNAFHTQVECYQLGLAPKPGKLFSIPLKGAGEYGKRVCLYGYTTEVAIMSHDVAEEDCYRVKRQLEDAGLPSGDLHLRNVGYVVDEKTDTFKLVPIDFGKHFKCEW